MFFVNKIFRNIAGHGGNLAVSDFAAAISCPIASWDRAGTLVGHKRFVRLKNHATLRHPSAPAGTIRKSIKRGNPGNMKRSILVAICLSTCLSTLSLSTFAQAPETFDIATFRSPKGWNKQPEQYAVKISTSAGDDFCLITLFKSLSSLGTSKTNFDASWETIVKDSVTPSSAPQMSAVENKDGWEILSGFAPFEKDGTKGVAVLVNATGYGLMVNAMVLTNTQAYQADIAAFLDSINLKKPAVVKQPPTPTTQAPAPSENSILGTWGQNGGASMTYGDPVAAGMAGYGKYQYTFNADGTYNFVAKTFRMSYDKIILVIENGTYQISGDSLSIKPQKSVIQAWSKLNGGDGWGRMLSNQARRLEPVTYKFTKHYFSGIQEWNLVLQSDRPTERDGSFSTFTQFPNAWYYKPISSNNPVILLPR